MMRISLFLSVLLIFTTVSAQTNLQKKPVTEPAKTEVRGKAQLKTMAPTQKEKEEEEDDDDGVWSSQKVAVVPKFDEAKIVVDGKIMKIQDQFVTVRNKVLQVKISQLMPMSWLSIDLEKAGVGKTKTRYQSNEKGELELEIKSGKMKAKGSLLVHYKTSSGLDKEYTVYIRVD